RLSACSPTAPPHPTVASGLRSGQRRLNIPPPAAARIPGPRSAMSWWLWVVIGILLVGIELLSPGGFYVIFFGLSALLVGALRGFGGIEPLWLQWLLFSVLAVGSLVLFRNRLVKRLQPGPAGSHV